MTLALMRGDEVPDADPVYDGQAPAGAGVPLGGATRDSLAPEGYEEVEEAGEDAWSLDRPGPRARLSERPGDDGRTGGKRPGEYAGARARFALG